MTKPRVLDPDGFKELARAIVADHPAGQGAWHAHRRGQWVLALEGCIRVGTSEGTWWVPPQRGVWIPPGMLHAVGAQQPYRLLTVYLDPSRVSGLPGDVQVAMVDPLLRALSLKVGDWKAGWKPGGPEERVVKVLVDQLRALEVDPSALAWPRDPRARRVAEALAKRPDRPEDVEAWAKLVHCSPRTLLRRFQEETGLSLGQWRLRLRMLRALESLAAGHAAHRVALELGYASPSAFGVAFRKVMGETPGHFLMSRGT